MKTPDPNVLKGLVEDSGISYRQNTVSWIFSCPKCSKRDKVYLRKRDGQFICFYCSTINNYRGRPEILLRDLLGFSYQELKTRLYGDQGVDFTVGGHLDMVPLEEFFGPTDEPSYELLPPAHEPYPLDFYPIDEPEATRGRIYLESRGIDLDTAKRYGIHYHPKETRVIFPISLKGIVIGWQARTILPSEGFRADGSAFRIPKILTSKGIDRNRCLMFQDRIAEADHVLLVEGPVDAIKADLCGGNVASMGKFLSPGQIDIILEAGKRVYLALDPDAASEMNRLCKAFAHLGVYQLTPAQGFEDLGEMSFEGVLKQFKSAKRINNANLFIPPLVDRFS